MFERPIFHLTCFELSRIGCLRLVPCFILLTKVFLVIDFAYHSRDQKIVLHLMVFSEDSPFTRSQVNPLAEFLS